MLDLNFTPHSYYKGYAIKKNDVTRLHPLKYTAYTDDGVYTYSVVSISANTLKDLKIKINNDIKRLNDKDAANRRLIGEL